MVGSTNEDKHLVKMIPIEKMVVLNPRDRNKKKFEKIAYKIDMNPEYIRGVLRLLERGEERLPVLKKLLSRMRVSNRVMTARPA